MYSPRGRPPKDERDNSALAKLVLEGKTREAEQKAREIIARQEHIAEQRRQQFGR